MKAKAKFVQNMGGSVPPAANNASQKVLTTQQKKKAIFLKPAVIHDASVGDGQCSKKNGLVNDDMQIDFEEETDREMDGGLNIKGKKEKEKWCFRCCTKGHLKEACSVDLFCNICDGI